MDFLENSLYVIHRISVLDKFEIWLIRTLIKWFGMEGAVVAEHLLIMSCSMYFGYLLCLFVRATKYKAVPNFRMRFSDEMNDLLFIKIHKEEVSELIVRTPRTLKDKIEIYITMLTLKDVLGGDISERKIRRTAIVFLALITLFFITVIIILSLIFNVAGNHMV